MNLTKSENNIHIKKLKKAAQKMGYFKDQSGIIKRFINEEGQWNNHLNLCKKYIRKCVQNKIKNKCAVLGSGWLLDVPLEYLSNHFSQVYLVDIFHPKQIQISVERYNNVYFITEDLTGGAINEIYYNRKNIKQEGLHWLNNLKLRCDFFYHDFDFVISLNILNQLDILIADYFKLKFNFHEEDMKIIRKQIQKNHVRSLPKGKTCLITDSTEMLFDENNHIVNSKNLIHTSINKIKNKEAWNWNFDTKLTYNKNFKTVFKVIAGEL